MEIPLKVRVIKNDGKDRLHRIRLTNPTIDNVIDKCRGWITDTDVAISYRDSDGDDITVGNNSEMEWRECVSVFKQSGCKVLELTVTPIYKPTSTVVSSLREQESIISSSQAQLDTQLNECSSLVREQENSSSQPAGQQKPTAPPSQEIPTAPPQSLHSEVIVSNDEVIGSLIVASAPEIPNFKFKNKTFRDILEIMFGNNAIERSMNEPLPSEILFSGCAVIKDGVAIPTDEFPMEVITHTYYHSQDAKNIIQQAIEVCPQSKNLWYELAVIQVSEDDLIESKESLETSFYFGCPVARAESDDRLKKLFSNTTTSVVSISPNDPYASQRSTLAFMGYVDNDRFLEAFGGDIDKTIKAINSSEQTLLDREDSLYAMGYTDAENNQMLLSSYGGVDEAALHQPHEPKKDYSQEY